MFYNPGQFSEGFSVWVEASDSFGGVPCTHQVLLFGDDRVALAVDGESREAMNEVQVRGIQLVGHRVRAKFRVVGELLVLDSMELLD
jgi:hypothetical protein